ncbi:MAG: glucose-1-phosphate thymidylyltransferase [Nitrosotalea sp.]
MKGIILHGGYGTRLRPLTHTGPKQLLPIANKPMSQYALEDLREAGITEIGIIIGDVYPEKVKEFYGDGSKFGVNITYIFQDKPRGISHAIRLCKDFIKNDRFVVYLGDNILRKGLVDYTKKFQSSKADSLILLCEVDDPSRFGIAELDNTNSRKIKKIMEKPKNSPSNLAVIGVYFLTPKIFDIIDKLKPSWRGELEITEALQLLMENGHTIEYDTVTGWWKDTGTPEDILHANQLILDTLGTQNQFVLSEGSQVQGNVVMGKNSTISRDSFVTGPAIIGDNCNVGPAVRIGPHVSIGNNCSLKYCDVENSILMDDCSIDTKIHISDSIIAHGSQITNNHQAKKHQFLLGERSQVKL